MLKSLIAAIVVLVGTMLVPSLALACEGGKVLFEDKFEKFNPAWGFTLDPKTEKLDASGLVFDYPPNSYRRGISQLSFYTDYVACVTFTVKFTCTDPAKCETQPYFGLVVLAADSQNFYAFDVAPATNTFGLYRMQNNKWLNPIAWTAMPDNKKFANSEKVEVQATVKGGNMKFKVNGKDLLEFDGVAPDGGSLVGFEMTTISSDTKNTLFNLSNVTIKELPQ